MLPSDIPLRHSPSSPPLLTLAGCLDFISHLEVERQEEVKAFLAATFTMRKLGLNPDVLVGMSALETGYWSSERWQISLNPGGIGATDDGAWGTTFPNGSLAAKAMAVHLMAYARGHDNRLAHYIHLDPRFVKVHEAGLANSAKTLAGLGSGKWATDPFYPEKVLARILEVKG